MAVNFASVALQLEKVIPNAQKLWQDDKNILWNRLKPRQVETVSGRAMRIPLNILRGGQGGFLSPDGGSFGRGSGYTPDVAQLSPVFTRYNVEITAADIAATDGSEKAITNFLSANVSQGLDGFQAFNETLLVGDGSATLGSVVSFVTGPPYVITVPNPSQFQDGQVVDVWSGLAGTNRGSIQVTSVDFVGKTLTINNTASTKFGTIAPASLTGGLTNGDLLLANGAPGTAGSTVLGIKYHQAARSSGTWLGLNVATYPGKLTTPYFNAAGAPLSQGLVRLVEDKMRRALGINAKEVDNFVWLMGLDMRAQWESLGTLISSVIYNQLPGDKSVDVVKKNPMTTAAGHEIIVSNRATPQRIDGLCLDHWGRGEIQPMGPYNLDGKVAHLTYGTDGSIATSVMYNWWAGYNVFIDNPLAGCYSDTIQAQPNY
jgi:hypothetical protein